MRELALEHAAGSLGDEAYLDRLKVLRGAAGRLEARTAAGIPAERAVEWLRALGESLEAAECPRRRQTCCTPSTTGSSVAGPEIVGVRLTPAAYAHGLALALPEKVELARPTGFEPATFGSGPTPAIAPSSGSECWASPSKPQTYRRRRPT